MTDYTKWCVLNKKTKASKGGTQLWDKWRVMSGALVKLFRYELFANAFATSDTAFFRQTLFGGLSFEIDS